jgi:hypothetical protein
MNINSSGIPDDHSDVRRSALGSAPAHSNSAARRRRAVRNARNAYAVPATAQQHHRQGDRRSRFASCRQVELEQKTISVRTPFARMLPRVITPRGARRPTCGARRSNEGARFIVGYTRQRRAEILATRPFAEQRCSRPRPTFAALWFEPSSSPESAQPCTWPRC